MTREGATSLSPGSRDYNTLYLTVQDVVQVNGRI